MVKCYYEPLRQVYSIIIIKIPSIKPNLALQIFFKAINNFVNSNRLVFTLLVFDAYLRMPEQDALSRSITQRALIMQKAIDEIQRFTASRQINDALNAYIGSFIVFMHDLSINLSILIYCKRNASQLRK